MTDTKSRALSAGRIGWVDAGKGLSILLVVLYHSTSWLRSAGFEVGVLDLVNRMLADLRMPVFFFLSGLFAAKFLQSSWRELFASKISLFVWIYLLWSVLELPAKWLAMSQLTHKIDEGFLVSQLFVVAAIPVRASGALWFIWALAVFFLFAKLTYRWPLWLQFVLAAVVALATRTAPPEFISPFMELTGLGPRGCLVFYIFFLIGCYLRRIVMPVINRIGKLAASGIVLAWAALWFSLDSANLLQNGYVSFLMAFIGCFAGIAVAILLSHSSWLKFLGSRTLPVYVMHSSLLIILTTVLTFLPATESAIIGVILALVSSGFTVTLALIIYAYRGLGYDWLFRQPNWLMNGLNSVRSAAKEINARK